MCWSGWGNGGINRHDSCLFFFSPSKSKPSHPATTHTPRARNRDACPLRATFSRSPSSLSSTSCAGAWSNTSLGAGVGFVSVGRRPVDPKPSTPHTTGGSPPSAFPPHPHQPNPPRPPPPPRAPWRRPAGSVAGGASGCNSNSSYSSSRKAKRMHPRAGATAGGAAAGI